MAVDGDLIAKGCVKHFLLTHPCLIFPLDTPPGGPWGIDYQYF